jgi:phage N-6-adenine-methyltransferase
MADKKPDLKLVQSVAQMRNDAIAEIRNSNADAADLVSRYGLSKSEETLPTIVDRASRRLMEARNSAEVLEAKRIAEAALHYAKVTKAANETHADCLRIITRAEMRMADEVDADPSIARNGQHGQAVQTLDSLGLDRRRIAEWREVRDAGEDRVEQAIQDALDEGRAPTKADIQRNIRAACWTGNNEWYTPAEYIEMARAVLGTIDVDPASNAVAQETVRAATFYTKDDDGLTKDWKGRVWLNPPYAQPLIAYFADKMVSELKNGNVSAGIVLVNNFTDTQWFHKLEARAGAICFTKGRIRFQSPVGGFAAPPNGHALFYFGKDADRFARVFGSIGFIR